MQYIGYLCADIGVEEMALALVKGGVDCLEIGLPFSDPIADGPVIQEAVVRALKNGITPKKVLEAISRIRERTDVPIILFTYLNPLLQAGPEYLKAAYDAGVTGVLVVDLPVEYAQAHIDLCRHLGLDTVFVVSPSTSAERLKKIAEACTGFIYYAQRKGTTGIRHGLPADLRENLERIRTVSDLPIAVGFGISERKDVQEIRELKCAAVVGSKFVKALLDGCGSSELTELARSLFKD